MIASKSFIDGRPSALLGAFFMHKPGVWVALPKPPAFLFGSS
jgi:hypothetical protein